MTRIMETASSEDIAGDSGLLEVPGKYHILSEDVLSDEFHNSGKSFNGLSIRMKVLKGEQKGKVICLALFDPRMDSKDGGKIARAKQTAFLIATNILTPSQLGSGSVSYDEQIARGAQLIVEFSKKKDSDYLDWKYTNIYHVDDPRAKSVAKCEESLKMIPKEHRHPASYLESLTKKKADSKSANGPAKEADFTGI